MIHETNTPQWTLSKLLQSWDYFLASPHLSFGGMVASSPSSSLAQNYPLLEVSTWVHVSTRSPLYFSNFCCSTTRWGYFWGCMLKGYSCSLSTTKSLTFSFLLKALYAWAKSDLLILLLLLLCCSNHCNNEYDIPRSWSISFHRVSPSKTRLPLTLNVPIGNLSAAQSTNVNDQKSFLCH